WAPGATSPRSPEQGPNRCYPGTDGDSPDERRRRTGRCRRPAEGMSSPQEKVRRRAGRAAGRQSGAVRHMRRALELAARGRGRTSPNPLVGCVIVAPDGSVVGEGWHPFAGGPHADAAALASAGGAARGAPAYATLARCAHHGRTPPCTEALIAAGVAEVVVAHLDPGPGVSGRGVGRLEAAG